MSGIRVLEDRHRQVAAEMIRGTPRREIAQKYGISTSTVQEWTKDPLFQAYMGTLREEVRAARRERLLPVTMKAAEAVEALLARMIADAAICEDPVVRLEACLRVLKVTAELEHDEAPVAAPLRISIRKANTIGGVAAISPDDRAPVLLPAVTESHDESTHEA